VIGQSRVTGWYASQYKTPSSAAMSRPATANAMRQFRTSPYLLEALCQKSGFVTKIFALAKTTGGLCHKPGSTHGHANRPRRRLIRQSCQAARCGRWWGYWQRVSGRSCGNARKQQGAGENSWRDNGPQAAAVHTTGRPRPPTDRAVGIPQRRGKSAEGLAVNDL
jgi:hypothetical protein